MSAIDHWLGSEETGAPFTHCVRCRLPLLETAAPWLVNKEYHRGECILEYAVCLPCRDQVTARFCERSKSSIRRFIETEIAWDARVAEFMLESEPAARFDRCIACRTPRGECDGFAISALLDCGGRLVCGPLPLMLCRGCMDRMTAGLSPESRALWRAFLSQYLPGVGGGEDAGQGLGLL